MENMHTDVRLLRVKETSSLLHLRQVISVLLLNLICGELPVKKGYPSERVPSSNLKKPEPKKCYMSSLSKDQCAKLWT